LPCEAAEAGSTVEETVNAEDSSLICNAATEQYNDENCFPAEKIQFKPRGN